MKEFAEAEAADQESADEIRRVSAEALRKLLRP